MADVYDCQEILSWDVSNLSCTPKDFSGEQHKYCINLRFIGVSYTREWICSLQDDGVAMEYDDKYDPQGEIRVHLNLQQLSEFPNMRETIKGALKSWHILSGNILDALISYTVEHTSKFIGQFVPRGENVFNVDIKLTLEHAHTVVPSAVGDFMEQIVQRVMEESVPRMVPATEASIKSLKRKRMTADSDENSCVICLEELSGGCEGVLMPCSHAFHGDCIQEWLKTSHSCPICRFKMTTE